MQLLMTDAPVVHTRMSIPVCNEPSAFSWHACLNHGSSVDWRELLPPLKCFSRNPEQPPVVESSTH